MRLGIALARIKSMEEEDLPDEETDEGKILKRLFELRRSLHKTPARVREVLIDGIPDSRCNPESRLVGNEAFFTAYLLEYNLKEDHTEHCHTLSCHLNDCFQCFQNYSDTVRDFLHTQ